MNINKNNYEAFFLDYHEGNLSPQQVADLLLFIDQHPELKEEFETFENVSLEDFSEVTFENKSGLKKEITIDNKEEYFIKSIEETITPTEKILLANFLKQHPQYAVDLELFHKTRLKPDNSIVFENKEALKRVSVTADDLFIASVEGLLSKAETVLLYEQLAADPEMQHHLSLYKQTKLIADTSVSYEDKEELKRKKRKAISLFYYVAVAASLLFLFGLYFLIDNKSNEQEVADKNQPAPIIKSHESAPDKKEKVKANSLLINGPFATVAANNSRTLKTHTVKNKIQIIAPANKEKTAPVNENSVAKVNEDKIENSPSLINNNEEPVINNLLANKQSQPVTAQMEEKTKTTIPAGFISLRELAAEKIKEKTLDNQTLALQKKNGRLKKFNGWDVAQIVTKGISKLTGHDLEVKPTYNNDGNVTAYALGSGIEVQRIK